MEILEKVAYMKGLAEGLGLDTKTKEGKLLTVMIDILDDIALELQDIRDDEDEEEDDEEEEDEDEVYETTCPNCEEDIFFDETILADGAVECPNCGERLEFDLGGDAGCCGGCCGGCESDEDEDEDEEDKD